LISKAAGEYRMDANYSLVHMMNSSCSPPELIHLAAKVGYDCVSLRTIPTRWLEDAGTAGAAIRATTSGNERYDLVKDKSLLRATKKAALEEGILIHDIENPRICDGVNVRFYEADLEVAAEMGARHILTNIWSDDFPFYTEQFSHLCELAEPYGLTVNLEFVTWSGVKDLSQAKKVLETAGKRNMGIVIDTLHAYRSQVRWEELDQLPGEWFSYAHLCDCGKEIPSDLESLVHAGRAERLYPGEGAVDFRGLIQRLPHIIRGLEIPSERRIKEYGFEEHARRALLAAKKILE